MAGQEEGGQEKKEKGMEKEKETKKEKGGAPVEESKRKTFSGAASLVALQS